MQPHAIWAVLIIFINVSIISSGPAYFELQPEVYSSQVGWFAPFHSGGGYCSEARSFALALSAVSFTNLTTIQHGDSWNRDYMNLESEREKRILQKYDMINFPSGFPRISICHSEPGAWYTPNPMYHTSRCPYDRPNGKQVYYRVGRTMFETDRLPSGWLPRLQYMDEIWVPTNFSRDIFIASGYPSDKLRVIEETVDTSMFVPVERRAVTYEKHKKLSRLSVIPSNTVVFLFVGKFEERKGIDILLNAYFTEFSSYEAVVLLLVTSAYHSSSDFEDQISKIKNNLGITKKNLPEIIILSGLNQDDMPVLYSFAQALVIPSHGEGWGRPHMEAMACGTPVVATNWSGPTAFMDSSNGYPVAIESELVPAK